PRLVVPRPRLKGRGTTYLAPPLEMLSFIFRACPNKHYLLPGLVDIERVFKGEARDNEPVTVLVSPVHDPPSAATRPDPTRYVAHKKMPSPASSDSEDDEPAPSHLPVPPPLLVSLPLSPPTPPTPGVPDEMPSDEAVTAALETFFLGSSVGAEVEVGGDEFAEAAGMVDAIIERLADPPTPSAPSAPSAPRKRKSEEKRRERKTGKGASSKLKRR
ncbi:hypothetical protein CAPTEDRAFT_210021, partial [Capitella teleta]